MGIEFSYDEFSRRILKKVTRGESPDEEVEIRQFIWDSWMMIGEFSDNGSSGEEKSFLWGIDLSGTEEGVGGAGGLLAVRVSGAVFLPTYDGNGNIESYFSAASETVVESIEYGPFGETIQPSRIAPFGFSSRYYDTETGLNYYGFRYSDPATGKWTTREPLGENASRNLYTFVGNRPTDGIDILGLFHPGYLAPAVAGTGVGVGAIAPLGGFALGYGIGLMAASNMQRNPIRGPRALPPWTERWIDDAPNDDERDRRREQAEKCQEIADRYHDAKRTAEELARNKMCCADLLKYIEALQNEVDIRQEHQDADCDSVRWKKQFNTKDHSGHLEEKKRALENAKEEYNEKCSGMPGNTPL